MILRMRNGMGKRGEIQSKGEGMDGEAKEENWGGGGIKMTTLSENYKKNNIKKKSTACGNTGARKVTFREAVSSSAAAEGKGAQCRGGSSRPPEEPTLPSSSVERSLEAAGKKKRGGVLGLHNLLFLKLLSYERVIWSNIGIGTKDISSVNL